MKKLLCLAFIAAAIVSCKKNDIGAPVSSLKNKMLGKWNFISVTTVFRDTAGNIIPSGMVYANPSGSFYQFNKNGTWASKFLDDPTIDLNNRGFYTPLSDTSFTLSDTGKFAYSETCKIYALTPAQFIFSHTRNIAINGVTPATMEYVFKLTK
ncbi:hypothetical protein [Mucilaginibacter ginsenosidivorans]|uniref:Lipocalin-like domain-containing protein n=1 Tax=Mucilaginibacter ginsenosidivorans TaxID=398053 RepID=A0A5B8V2E8_9SPHI|nr:hypothetical protein [Mucilaginibacter ginsenosidivorans]QEC65245.1 hypothetical protein FRZ54_22625 [Mucilaginibacter ginsenosidivorans]